MNLKDLSKRPTSLAFRVTILVGLTIFLCLTFISLMVQESIAQHFAEQDANELNEVFIAVKRKLYEANNRGISPTKTLFHAVSGHHGVYYLVQNEVGDIVFSSENAALERYPGRTFDIEHITPSSLSIFYDGEHKLRSTKVIVPVQTSQTQTQYKVIVASNMEFHMNYMEDFETNLWAIIALSGTITILVARFAVYRGHSPIRRLSRKIGSISTTQLDIRLDPIEVPVELTRLVESFNDMIERVENGYEQLSHFSDDIAHELRTPITNLTTQTQVILNQPRSIDEYSEILYSNLEEYERMSKMVSDMLLLAQTEHGLIKPNTEVINCQKEISALIEYFELIAEEKHIHIQLHGHNIELRCDKSMFRQAISNLLSNAIRYAPSNAEVILFTQIRDDEAHISISNPGKKISKNQLHRIFDRFYRTDPSRKRDGQGAGLGLTIARSVMEVNAGHIRVESNEQTTTFTVILPLNH
ncbi:heavy metal sensor histidine kinase [Paraglaciecola chathamensis]|nr:heavy metal sensor histidine kinase [Paraglaciecola oceanifecundans]